MPSCFSIPAARNWKQVNNLDKVAYRFHFNGQETDDEIAGKGNINTAEFWEYDTRLGRRWNVDPKLNSALSPYSCLGNNPIFFTDIKGDTIRINLFGWSDRHFYTIAQDMGDGKDDGVFLVTAHGYSGAISNDKNLNSSGIINIRTANGFNQVLSSISPIWAEGMRKQRPMIVILLACNTASVDYLEDHYKNNVTKMVHNDQPIAYEISKTFKNLTVIAADGFVRFGRSPDGKPRIDEIRNYKNNGGLVEIKQGIAEFKTFYLKNIKPFRIRLPFNRESGKHESPPKLSPRFL